MGRLLKKIPRDLNDLPSRYETRLDLVNAICKDQHVLDLVKQVRPLPGEPTIDFTDPVSGLMKSLFMGTSWRLTLFGCAFMLNTYKSYSARHESNLRIGGRVLLNLGRIIRGPWHVHNMLVYVWDQQVHFELAMFDGDVCRFVDFNAPK